jgi:hypothetical protein
MHQGEDGGVGADAEAERKRHSQTPPAERVA